jgi:glucose-6-phosphate isomerase
MDRLAAYAELRAHFAEIKDVHMRDLFASDSGRFDKFSARFEDIILDCTLFLRAQPIAADP